MSELRPSNRRDFVRLRVYGVACEFKHSPPGAPGVDPHAVLPDPPAEPAQVPDLGAEDIPERGSRGIVVSGRYRDMIAQVYRSDRVVRIERRQPVNPRPADAERPAGTSEAADPETVSGELIDVGGGGARFAVREGDWPVRARPAGRLTFEISGQRFDFRCELVRKTESARVFEYVATWRRPLPSEIDRLMRAIYQVELSRRQPHGPAPSKQPPPRPRKLGFDRRTATWTTAGLIAGGALFLFAGPYALPAWAALAAALLVAWLLAG